MTYKNFNTFGKTLIDKVAILGRLRNKYTFDFDGENHLYDLIDGKSGGIIINAHVGNFEIAGQLLERLDTKFNVMMFDAEHQQLKKYLSDVMENKNVNIIAIKEDLSHTIQIANAFQNNELIAMGADRFVNKNSTVKVNFLGKEALLPTGPFLMAAKFQVPVTIACAFKESKFHYHFYAIPAIKIKKVAGKDKQLEEIKIWAQKFADNIERLIKEYPEQWFNYYDFWEN